MPDTLAAVAGAELPDVPGSIDPGTSVLKRGPVADRIRAALNGLDSGSRAILVIALAMNTGFRLTLQDRLLGVTAHVNIQKPGGEGLADYFALAQRLGRTPGVRAVAPAIYLTVLLSSGNRARGVVLKGIDPALEAKRNEALQHIVSGSGSGSGDFVPDSNGIDSIVVGKILAEELGLHAGDYVSLTSPSGRLTPFGLVPGPWPVPTGNDCVSGDGQFVWSGPCAWLGEFGPNGLSLRVGLSSHEGVLFGFTLPRSRPPAVA